MKQYTTRKFNGDDSYSWAVFRKSDLPKGQRGIVFLGEARPVVSGCSRSEAQYHAKNLEERYGSS
jgi:hypothetical protein